MSIDYEKNQKDTAAYISRKFDICSKSPLFRIEGSNGCGKTLILETIAYAMSLDPEKIHDEWLRRFYLDYCEGKYDQKVSFNLDFRLNDAEVIAQKEKTSKTAFVKVNGQARNSLFIQEKFPIFFDSIKSPEKQAQEYLKDVNIFVIEIEEALDKFHAHLNKKLREIDEYLNAEKKLEENESRLKNLKSEREKLESEIKKVNYMIEKLKLLKLNIEIKKINEDMDYINKQIKIYEEEEKNKNKIERKYKELSKKYSEALANYRNAHSQLFDHSKFLERLKAIKIDDNVFQAVLKLSSPSTHIKDVEFRLYIDAIDDVLYKFKLEKLNYENNNNLEEVTFYEEFYEFIGKHLVEFSKRYPKLYDEITNKHSQLSKYKKNLDEIEDIINKLRQLKNSMDKLYETADNTEYVIRERDENMSKIDSSSIIYKLKKDLEDKKTELAIKNKEIEAINNGMNMSDIKYNIDNLDKECDTIEKVNDKLRSYNLIKQNLRKDLDETDINIRNTQENIISYKNQKENPPPYINEKQILSEMNESIGNIIIYLTKMKNVIKKLLEHSNKLDDDEKNIAVGLGQYLATIQKNIYVDPLKSNIPLKIKEIDLINNAYILEDGSSYPFQSNTGNVLINTLIGKIRSLDEGKYNILLIDEVSPLDSNNLELLEKEILNQIKQRKVFLAAIAIPGNKYSDNVPHIVEVNVDE